jgi:hypothetical protein
MIVVDRASYSTKLGTVWYEAQQVASMLLVTVVDKESVEPEGLLSPAFEEVVGNELDKLLNSAERERTDDPSGAGSSRAATPPVNPPSQAGLERNLWKNR